MNLKIIWVAIPLLLIISCSQVIQERKNSGGITGIVADKTTGEPVRTVQVSLSPGGSTTVTGMDGSFQFTHLESGSYTVDIEKEGYKQESSSVVVFDGKTTETHLLIERIPAVITADRDVLDFGDNAGVTQLSVSIVNPWYQDLHWSVSWDNQVKWIREVLGPSGTTEGTLGFGKTASLIIRIDRDALANGYNEAVIVIWSDNGRSELIVTATGADRHEIVINVLPVTKVGQTSAVLVAEVQSKGAPEYFERGFVLSKSKIKNDSTIDDLQSYKSEFNNLLSYTSSIANLSKGTHYYVRAYGINQAGIKFSANEEEFDTIDLWTEVKTLPVSFRDVVKGEAIFNGEITIPGNPVYSEKGFVYNTVGEPTIDDKKVIVSGYDSGKFSISCADLQNQDTWYVRAYVIQSGSVLYGSSVYFSMSQTAAEVKTIAPTSVTSNSATLHGVVTKIGNPAATERGFCFSMSPKTTPTITDNKRMIAGVDTQDYSLTISNLQYGRRYYYCAYVMQNGNPIYGDPVPIDTKYDEAKVETSEVSDVKYNNMTFNATVLSAGDPKISERGFCYSSTYDMPSERDTKVIANGTTAGDYHVSVSGLKENTKYFVRAYVIQDGEYYYGSTKSETTGYKPIVVTGPASNISAYGSYYWQATLQGAFADGNPYVAEVGFVYSNYNNPEIGSNNASKVQYDKVTQLGDDQYKFTKTVKNFNAYKTYYYRAYVRTYENDVFYGETYSFQTY